MIITVNIVEHTFFVAKHFTKFFNGKGNLTYLLPMLRFYPEKHQKTARFSDVFRGYENVTEKNGLMVRVFILSVSICFLKRKFK